MVYPQTKLTRPIRRGIMFFLIMCFFIFSPIIILYATGYRYDFKTNEIKQTGVISIDVKPKNASVFLNNVKIKQKFPIYLTNRAPGTYTVKITLPGYQDWQKNITVKSKETTYIKNVTLFKIFLPVNIAKNIKGKIININSSNDGSYILIITKTKKIYEVYLFNTVNQKLESINRTKTDFIPKIIWSPYANFAIIKTKEKNKEIINIFNPLNLEDYKSYTFLSPIENYQWSKNTFNPLIYIKQDNQIISLNNTEQRNVAFIKSNVWFVQDTNISIYSSQDKNLVNNNGKEKFDLKDKDEMQKIIDINNDRIIIQSKLNTFVLKLNNDQIKETDTLATQHIFYNQNTKEWLSWSWWELWTIYENGDSNLLTRTSDKIVWLWSLDPYGVLALASKNKITGFNPGYYVNHELLHNVDIQQFTVNNDKRKIFFLGKVGQTEGLFELEY